MTRKIRLALFTTIFSILSHKAQTGAIALGTASVQIVSAMAIQQQIHLSFGTLKVLGPGTVTVDPQTGQVTYTGEVYGVVGQSPIQGGKFKVNGTPGCMYMIQVPSEILLSNGQGQELTIHSVSTYLANLGAIGNISTLDQQGQDTVTIGGTLNIPDIVISGEYQGMYNVNVEYN